MWAALRTLLETQGLFGAAWVVARRVFKWRAGCFPAAAELCRGKRGIELGGPSAIFRAGGLLPVYPLLTGLDGANFSNSTVWEGQISEQTPFVFEPGRQGRQFIRECTDLHGIADGAYDFALSSHMLEHTANPLKALAEVARVLKPGGAFVLVLPHRDGVPGDRGRPVSTLEHLRNEFRRNAPEGELGEEQLRLRTAHLHVFDTRLVAQCLDEAGFEVLEMEAVRPFNIIALARKSPTRDNARWLDAGAPHLRGSVFPTDRRHARPG